MDTNLTLTIEKDVINDAKRYAKQKGVSLPEIVENYFILLNKASKSENFELSSGWPASTKFRSGDSGIISKSILNMGLVNSIFRLVQDIDRLTG